MSPYGGELAAKTGGIGWDISMTTELLWNFSGEAFTVDPTSASGPLYALFRSCPFKISGSGSDFQFDSQAIYDIALSRSPNAYSTSTFTMVYEETPSGKRYEACGCVCIPKFSFEAGGKIMVEWSIKGKWRPVADSTNLVPTYSYLPPLIGLACTLSGAQFGAQTSALAKVSYDPGFALSDVLDAQETFGMGIAMITLTSSPSIEVEVADLSETFQDDWTAAETNAVDPSGLLVSVAISTSSLDFFLTEAQLIQWPTPGESNGYRNIGLKFAGIVNANSVSSIGYIKFNA
jgi:hypothetical protein